MSGLACTGVWEGLSQVDRWQRLCRQGVVACSLKNSKSTYMWKSISRQQEESIHNRVLFCQMKVLPVPNIISCRIWSLTWHWLLSKTYLAWQSTKTWTALPKISVLPTVYAEYVHIKVFIKNKWKYIFKIIAGQMNFVMWFLAIICKWINNTQQSTVANGPETWLKLNQTADCAH